MKFIKRNENNVARSKATEIVNYLVNEFANFTRDEDGCNGNYEPNSEYVRYNVDRCFENKAWLINAFRNLPGWDEENLRIKVPITVERKPNPKVAYDFYLWVRRNVNALYEANIGLFKASEYLNYIDNLAIKKDDLGYSWYTKQAAKAEHTRITNELERMRARYREENLCTYDGVPMKVENYHKVKAIDNILYILLSGEISPVIKEEDAARIKGYLEDGNLKTRISAGQKLSRAISKLCIEIGANKIKCPDKKTWTDDDGNYHEREFDSGYEHQFAKLSEAVNEGFIESEMYVGLNPIDFYTMSKMDGTSSCHDISRGEWGWSSKTYHGMYSGGPASYVNDKVTVIAYIPSSKGDYRKTKRCVFSIDEDKIAQSRVYPDGRDGDIGYDYAKAFRHGMQKLVADAFGLENKWVKKGRDAVVENIKEKGAHYSDLTNCPEVTLSVLKGSDNTEKIHVGNYSYCIECGTETDFHPSLCCSECAEGGPMCTNCGDPVSDYWGISVDGNQFCCESCAESYGYVHTYDSEEWVREDEAYLAHDENGNEVYCQWSDELVETLDGEFYVDEYAANRNDFYYCCDLEDYVTDDWFIDSQTGEYYHYYEDTEFIEVDGNWFASEENANEYGYVHCVDDDKFHWENDCTEIDGTWYFEVPEEEREVC